MGIRRDFTLVFAFISVLCISNGITLDQANILRSVGSEILKFIPSAEVYERCEKEKGAAVFGQIHNEWQESVACLTSAVPDMFSSPDWNGLIGLFNGRDIGLQAVKRGVKNACNIISEAKKCFRNVFDEIKVCLTDKENKNVNILWNTVFAGSEFFCRDNGAKFIDFYLSDGVQCYSFRERSLEKCTDGYMNFVRDKVDEPLMFNKKNCKILDDTTSCMITEMSQCPIKNASAIVRDFFHSTVHKLPCDIYGKNTASLPTYSKWILALISVLSTLSIL